MPGSQGTHHESYHKRRPDHDQTPAPVTSSHALEAHGER